MGERGQDADPQMMQAVDRVQAAVIRRGVQFLTTQTDIGRPSSGAGAWTQGIRTVLKS
jgi:hypothetical protein